MNEGGYGREGGGERAEGSADVGRTHHRIRRFAWGVPGTLLTLSVIGAPLGLLMLRRAHRHQRRLDDRAESAGYVRRVVDSVFGRSPSRRYDPEELSFDGSGGDR